ncbi:THAP domain-containing protein 2-like isoform X2 [Melanotaenia boesemani]|uniref:THAP domain-containing protein 2-like isoform X2 n=1 Tax=Melanotaenia boesemani TaxID=1250792 RepID=UPI001C03E343|nr:THAP domain-containing protein 2-like isoform X2 [Melanotaenia boesemani]
MPDFCSAYGCSNERSIQTRSHGITFHRFPKDGGLRQRWEQAVRRAGFVVTRRSLLCSEHFKPEDFDRTGQTVRLRPEVIPSVFNFPTSLRKVAARTTLPAKTAEESPLEDLTRLSSEVKPQTNVDHNYAFPLKARLSEALVRMENLEQEKHNNKIPELRAKKNLGGSEGEEAP